MKLPRGRLVAESSDTLAILLQQYSRKFQGVILVTKAGHGLGSNGYVLIENGTVMAAAYNLLNITLYQTTALDRMMSLNSIHTGIYEFTDDELRTAVNESRQALIVAGGKVDTTLQHTSQTPPEIQPLTPVTPVVKATAVYDHSNITTAVLPELQSNIPAAESVPTMPTGFDKLLSSFNELPGVLGSALVADGFPVYQEGKDVDFEHVAAATEDMVRAGSRIAAELQLGDSNQIILETPDYKVVIAPISDMFLCVLTRADANLGLVRLNVKNAQKE